MATEMAEVSNQVNFGSWVGRLTCPEKSGQREYPMISGLVRKKRYGIQCPENIGPASTCLFVHCKIAYFYSVTAEKWLIVSLPNFVTIRRTHFSISCKIFSWIRSTKLKIRAMEFCDFIKDSVSPSGLFVPCSLTVTSTWRPRLTAHCPIGERHWSRSLATGLSVDSRINVFHHTVVSVIVLAILPQ